MNLKAPGAVALVVGFLSLVTPLSKEVRTEAAFMLGLAAVLVWATCRRWR
ncbi:MAG: hypothetical protein ACR2RB_22275 [Gammaproteobacteria bacterium]